MVVILLISVVIVIAGIAAAMRLSPLRVRRHGKAIEFVRAAVSEPSEQSKHPQPSERVTPLPVRRPRITETAARFRQMSAPANVKVLADYRKARAIRLRSTRVAGGLPRGSRPHRPEPA